MTEVDKLKARIAVQNIHIEEYKRRDERLRKIAMNERIAGMEHVREMCSNHAGKFASYGALHYFREAIDEEIEKCKTKR